MVIRAVELERNDAGLAGFDFVRKFADGGASAGGRDAEDLESGVAGVGENKVVLHLRAGDDFAEVEVKFCKLNFRSGAIGIGSGIRGGRLTGRLSGAARHHEATDESCLE